MTVALAARAWWWCLRLGGLAVALVAWEGLVVVLAAWGGFWASVSHGSASPSQGDGSPKMSHVISM